MFKGILLAASMAALMTSCDVRSKDKEATPVANESSTNTSTSNDPATTVATTTVQLIDSVYNFGKITEGEEVEFSYRFKNIGTSPLIISEASASCGCTVPEKPEQPILPGEVGYIKVKFSSQGRPGITHKTVTVNSNANPGFPLLVLEGDVITKK